MWGTLGQSCGTASAEVDRCESFCLGASEASGVNGFCTQACQGHSDCPSSEYNGQTYSFRCQSYVYSYGVDAVADEDNIFVGLCVPNPLGSSGEDCSGDLSCESESEACTSISVNFGPDYDAGTDYTCIDVTNNGTYTPTKDLGEACNPNAALDECKTMYCLADDTGLSGVCTAPCDPDNDQCGPGMVCQEDILFPRAGAYTDNAGTLWRCNTDTNCVPSCDGLACGSDGCGGDCGTCAQGETCTEGACVSDCIPKTECGVACGDVDNGCGGTLACGDTCAEGETCTEGVCVAGATTVNVDIVGFAFDPATIEVTTGTTVVWTNLDMDQHSVESRAPDGSVDPSGPLDSPLLSQDDTYEYTFDTPGVYDYRCGPHEGMQGTVNVIAE